MCPPARRRAARWRVAGIPRFADTSVSTPSPRPARSGNEPHCRSHCAAAEQEDCGGRACLYRRIKFRAGALQRELSVGRYLLSSWSTESSPLMNWELFFQDQDFSDLYSQYGQPLQPPLSLYEASALSCVKRAIVLP
jgi:hypothetical protein